MLSFYSRGRTTLKYLQAAVDSAAAKRGLSTVDKMTLQPCHFTTFQPPILSILGDIHLTQVVACNPRAKIHVCLYPGLRPPFLRPYPGLRLGAQVLIIARLQRAFNPSAVVCVTTNHPHPNPFLIFQFSNHQFINAPVHQLNTFYIRQELIFQYFNFQIFQFSVNQFTD